MCQFALLLPYSALKTAFRVAIQDRHPDHGGSTERTQVLISAWKRVEAQYAGTTRAAEVSTTEVTVN